MKTKLLALALLLTGLAWYHSSSARGLHVTTDNPLRSDVIVHAPKAGTGSPLKPLVLLLHGYSGSAWFMDSYFGLRSRVDARDFVLAVPEGLKNRDNYRYWNATPACCDFEHVATDDVGYLLSVVRELREKYPIDPARVYVVGHSNGGFMAHRLACEPGNPFAAIASLAGASFADPKDCQSTRPVSVLQIHADDDQTIHFAGDKGYTGLAAYPSVDVTVGGWVKHNDCAGPVTSPDPLNLTLSIPGPDATRTAWSHCRGGATVEFWHVRPYSSTWHNAHTPLLTGEFRDRLLDFLFAQKKTADER